MAEKVFLPGGIKERLEDLRNRRKLTLKDVSEKTGMTPREIFTAVRWTAA